MAIITQSEFLCHTPAAARKAVGYGGALRRRTKPGRVLACRPPKEAWAFCQALGSSAVMNLFSQYFVRRFREVYD